MPRPMDIIDPKKDLDKIEDSDLVSKSEKGDREEIFEIEQAKSGGAFYLILGIIALVVATGFALYILYSDKQDKTPSGQIEPTTTEVVNEEETAQTAPAEEELTETPVETVTQTTSDFSASSVRVANGNGTGGEAAKIKALLEEKGFSITSVGNASKTYDQTTIFYHSGKAELAEALKDALKESYNALTKESDVTVGNYDAVVALGKE